MTSRNAPRGHEGRGDAANCTGLGRADPAPTRAANSNEPSPDLFLRVRQAHPRTADQAPSPPCDASAPLGSAGPSPRRGAAPRRFAPSPLRERLRLDRPGDMFSSGIRVAICPVLIDSSRASRMTLTAPIELLDPSGSRRSDRWTRGPATNHTTRVAALCCLHVCAHILAAGPGSLGWCASGVTLTSSHG